MSSVETLNQSIAEWSEINMAISEKLAKLQELEIYKYVIGWASALEGPTRAKVENVLTAMDKLDQLYLPLLRTTIDRGKALRKNLPLSINGKRQEAIDQLLNDQSIVLETIAIPLEQQETLGPDVKLVTVSPQMLKEMIINAYEQAKKHLIELKETRDRAEQQFVECKTQASTVSAQAAPIGLSQCIELEELAAQLQRIDNQRIIDWMSLNNPMGALQPYLNAAHRRLAEFQKEREQIAQSVKHAKQRLAQLNSLRDDALRGHLEAKTAGCPEEYLERPASTKELATQLESIESDLAAQRWSIVKENVAQWLQSYDQQRQATQILINANRQAATKIHDVDFRLLHIDRKFDILKNLRIAAIIDFKRCQVEIPDSPDVITPGATKELQEALNKAKELGRNQRTAEALAAISAWEKLYETTLATMQKTVDTNKALLSQERTPPKSQENLLAQWQEAKSLAAQHRVLDKAFTNYAARIEAAFSANPPDLDGAARFINFYKSALAERLAGRDKAAGAAKS